MVAYAGNGIRQWVNWTGARKRSAYRVRTIGEADSNMLCYAGNYRWEPVLVLGSQDGFDRGL
jgi:hypothetical protein